MFEFKSSCTGSSFSSSPLRPSRALLFGLLPSSFLSSTSLLSYPHATHPSDTPHDRTALKFPPSSLIPSFSDATSFQVLSNHAIHNVNRNSLISATLIRFSCFFVTVTASISYRIAGVTFVLYIRPFSRTGTVL